jgi:glycosylphosphatidylinositol transamidase (GPIT) subunit GPI8
MLEDLNARQSRSPIFLISDSCSASTPFEGIDAPNFIGIGSSSEGEKSLSYGYDSLLNSPKSDEFTFYLT